MPPPSVSIVIDNFNYGRYLARSIESALTRTVPGVEVVVVDDASVDDSMEIIRRYGDRITAILQERNQGQGAAFNVGAGASHGEVVIFLDADDYLHPNAAAMIAAAWRPRASKVRYRLDLVDAEEHVIGLMPATEVRFDSGDVVPLLLLDSRHETTVTSGNAFSRKLLSRVLSIPSEDFRTSVDGYLVTVASFFGPVLSLVESLGAHRLHGANNWATGATSLEEHLRALLGHDEKRYHAIRARASELGLAASPSIGTMDRHHLTARMGSLVLDPARHPGDSRSNLIAWGIASARTASVALPWRFFLAAWLLVAGTLPRPISRRATWWRRVPSSRLPSVARVLRWIRRAAQPDPGRRAA